MTEKCGHPTATGSPCQHPTTPDGDPTKCWIPNHGGTADSNGGAPTKRSDRRERLILQARRDGLQLHDTAALAGISPDTLRRWLCCLEQPTRPTLTTEDPCQFCEDYAQAHAAGAREVLSDCRPEFVASASFGYMKREGREVTGEDGGAVEVQGLVDSLRSGFEDAHKDEDDEGSDA